jgi:TonB-dependent SusC/RagA subfamily outer membrane receptor
LKGASAAALWGTRAANGVIAITTKKGSGTKGKINVSVNSTYSIDKVYLTHDLTKNWGAGQNMQYQFAPRSGWSWGDYIPDRPGGADTYMTQPGEYFGPDGKDLYLGYFDAPDGTRLYRVPDGTSDNPHGGKNSRNTYDYKDQLFKTGSFWDNSVSLSGGDQEGSFYLSIGNLSQNGVIKRNSDYDRTTVRLNADRRFNEYVKLSTNMTYSSVKSNRTQMGSNTSGLYLGGLRTSPDFNSDYFVGTYTDPNGVVYPNRQRSYRNGLGQSTSSVYDNPLWMMDNVISTSEVDRFIGAFELTLSPVKWGDIIARVGVDTYSDRRKDFFDPLSSAFQEGRLQLQTIRETQVNADIFGNTHFQLSQDLTLNAVLGMNFNQRQIDNTGTAISNFIIKQLIPEDLTNSAPSNTAPFNELEYIRTAALYSSLDFGFKDQLFVNLTGRAESASTFGKNANATFFYPAANVAWQFTKLMGESDAFSFGKLRAGVGVVGVQPSPYNTVTYYTLGGLVESWGPTLTASAFGDGGYTEDDTQGNDDLKPERKTEIEFGTDLRFLQDRISFSATYFTNKTSDAILTVATAASTGFVEKVANAAEIENKGIGS